MGHAHTTAGHGHDGHAGHAGQPLVGHLVAPWILFATGGALIVLTVITVAIRYVDLGEANLLVALAIAGLKATLVSLFFMHLRWDRPFNQLIFLSGILFVVLMMVFCLMDTSQYRESQYVGNPVDVQAVLDKDAPNAPIAAQKSPDLP
jgi:cytochrome c oxidase subunit 4